MRKWKTRWKSLQNLPPWRSWGRWSLETQTKGAWTLSCISSLMIKSINVTCWSFAGISNRHNLCPDVDRQPPQIQQHYEETDSEQQHGWAHLAPRHHLQELQERRFPLDHDAQPAAPDLERWEDPVHTEVNTENKLLLIHWNEVRLDLQVSQVW